MWINKQETPELVQRQLAFYKTVGDNRQFTLTEGGYSYEFVPGTTPTGPYSVVGYLLAYVWLHRPLDYDAGDYVRYLQGLPVQCSSTVLDLLAEACQDRASNCLVHGDATLENFISTPKGIVPIDMGMPRGFCNPQNDLGKLLQVTLTHWNTVAYGVPAVPYVPLGWPVSDTTIASLISHWYRIVKNAHRHRAYVREYAVNRALPILTESLTAAVRAGRHRWDASRLEDLHHQLLPTGI